MTRLPSHQRAARGISRTFQITKLFPNLTVIDNVLLACAALDSRKFVMLRRTEACGDLMDRAEQVVQQFGLSDHRQAWARNLSYGDQRKLEVALSMAGRPRLLLLDEPMEVILEALDPAIAVLLIEHDMDIAFAFAERVTVLHQGRVLVEGPKDEVSANRSVQQIYLGEGGAE